MASDEANLGVIFKLDFLFVAVRTSVEITALLSVKSYSGPLAARPYDLRYQILWSDQKHATSEDNVYSDTLVVTYTLQFS